MPGALPRLTLPHLAAAARHAAHCHCTQYRCVRLAANSCSCEECEPAYDEGTNCLTVRFRGALGMRENM